MTITAMIAACDDAVLTAAANKGLLIRARKDVAAGAVTIGDTDTATVLDETVTLAATLAACRCTCPATGICRHILAVVLALRDAAPTPTATTPAQPAGFTLSEIETFAGKDWAQALAQTDTDAAETAVSDSSTTVTFPELAETVTFPAGQPLRAAYFKGPVAARKRRSIAAAALFLARAAGETLPEVTAATALPTVDSETLERARTALTEAAIALAAGATAAAQNRLFTLAISTRAEAVPRLAAELRGLSTRLNPDALRKAEETPQDVLSLLARTHALTRALAKAPDDPALVGVLARSFQPSGPKEVTFVGAEIWETPAGARGLSIYFADLATGSLHRATEARSAGTDLNFNPHALWTAPIWAARPRNALHGLRLRLPDAAMAADGGLGLTQTAEVAPGTVALPDLLGTGAVHSDWRDARTAARDQLGRGLRRRPGEALVLLAPAQIDSISFDAYAQRWVWNWHDTNGRSVALSLPHGAHVETLNANARRITAGLVALNPDHGMSGARLLSLWIVDAAPGPYALGLDTLPKPSGLGAMVGRLLDRAAPPAQSALPPLDPVHLFFDRAIEAVLTGLAGTPGLPERLINDATALGLGAVLQANREWQADGAPDAALHLAYLLAIGRDIAQAD